MEGMSDGVLRAPGGLIGELQGVLGGEGKRSAFLKTLTGCASEGYGAPVIKTGHFLPFWDGDDGSGLESRGNSSGGERLVGLTVSCRLCVDAAVAAG